MELIYLYSNDILKEKMSNDCKLVCTIGVFDGVHQGHKTIIDKVKKLANKMDAKTLVFTFDPHPDYILSKRTKTGYIMPLDERIYAFKTLGFDYCCILRCDEALINMPYQEFNSRFLAEMDAIVVGDDFRYGKNAKGNPNTLVDVTNRVVVMPLKMYDNMNKYASALIRKFLEEGNVKEANKLLIKLYTLSGVVCHGEQIGTLMNIKTANLQMNDTEFLIKNGVYKCKVLIDNKEYLSVCNIGTNPTIGKVQSRHLEAHIIDFDGDLYDKFIRVTLLEYLRDEKKFDSIDCLKEQIMLDIKKAKETK